MPFSQSQTIDFIRAENNVVYNNLAASTFFFWDQCLTLADERKLIWREKTSRVTILYYIIRYVTFAIRVVELVFYTNVSGILHPSHAGCIAWVWFEAFAGYFVFICVQIVLMMRVYAFYGKSKWLLAFLFSLFVVEHVVCLTVLAVELPKFKVEPSNLSPHFHVGACAVVKMTTVFPNYWVSGLVFESILFLLLIAMFVHKRWNKDMKSTHLLVVFVRDGAWGFGVIFALLLWCVLGFELNPQKGDIALTWLYSALGVVGSHLILNLREAAHEHLHRPQDIHLRYMGTSPEPPSPHPLSRSSVVPGIAY